MDFKKQVKDEEIWASEKQIQNVPGIIKKEYELLRESVQKDDICGALFRLKDIYEISMKLPCIIAIISISSYVEDDNDFIKMTCEELKKEHEEYLSEEKKVNVESEVLKKFGNILSLLLEKPLSIGSWYRLAETIVEHAAVFEVNENLKGILERTIKLHKAKPKKVNGEKGRYDNVSNWRNKTIGHGTLLINTDDYWEQVYDLVKGLDDYFGDDENEVSLSDLYSHIIIERNEGNETCNDRLIIGEKEYSISEYIYSLDDEQYFFDSYYSRENYTEITNYISAPKRLKNNTYYLTLYSLFSATKKGRVKKRGRQISNSEDREMYACLNSIPSYEKPSFVTDKIKDFIKENDKGILYIQMERGMGKSTLAHQLDGRYQKGILQKELKAVVRVYHIRDMLLRGENRTRDYFTALNNNLISYEGGQLEVDNEEYYVDGKDMRQLMEGEGEEASISFCQYLELFRSRYEEEIEDDDSNELNLVYIIDGIDELNSDTFSILNTIPDGKQMQSLSDDLVNHVYIVLLSRTKEEDNLPVIAKECIERCEKKANMVYKICSNDEDYYQLLKTYIARNYKKLSEESVCEIIEKAQRKFLYIQPYMAMRDSVITSGVKITAYDVAKNYISELQKLYCGTSLHTLQLIVSSIAVLHSGSLKDVCQLIVFTDVSYDVIGILNDILPLLATRRTDGEDIYEYANEEYEQYIYENMYEAVCEVICRYRISLVNWFSNVDKNSETYGKQWADYVRRALIVDGIAKLICFSETSEEYVRCLIYIWHDSNPRTFYAKVVGEELCCDVITQIRQLEYKNLELLSIKDLDKVEFIFKSHDVWYQESNRLRHEYTKEVINHCIEKGDIDEWFELMISRRITLCFDCDENRLDAFIQIVEQWENYNTVVYYIINMIKKDMDSGRKFSYGLYLERLLRIVNDKQLRIKIFEGLLNAYSLLADEILCLPRKNVIDDSRKNTMQNYIKEAEEYKTLQNNYLIKKIKDVVLNENMLDNTIVEIEELADKIALLDSKDYINELFRISLKEEDLSVEQKERYHQALIKNYINIIDHIKKIYDGKNADDIMPWLEEGIIVYKNCFSVETKEVLFEYLNLYDSVIKEYYEEKKIEKIWILELGFSRFLKYYDETLRLNSIGFYDTHYWSVTTDEKQKMTSWEKTYALYCSSIPDIRYSNYNHITLIANEFTNKYLQELYENGEYEKYYQLNSKITEGYETIDFINQYVLNNQYNKYKLIINYYRWIAVRYYRSLDGNDELSSDKLFGWLKREYDYSFSHVITMLNDELELIHKENILAVVKLSIKKLLFLVKMIPNSISSVVETKDKIISKLNELVKKTTNKAEIKKLVGEIIECINEPSEWYNVDIEFVVNTADRTIFDRYYDEVGENVQIPDELIDYNGS